MVAQFTGTNICNQLAGQQQNVLNNNGLISDAKITLVDNYFQQTQTVVQSIELNNAMSSTKPTTQKSLSSPKCQSKFNAPTGSSTFNATSGNQNRRSSCAAITNAGASGVSAMKTPSKQQQTVKENHYKSSQKNATQTLTQNMGSMQQPHTLLSQTPSVHTQS